MIYNNPTAFGIYGAETVTINNFNYSNGYINIYGTTAGYIKININNISNSSKILCSDDTPQNSALVNIYKSENVLKIISNDQRQLKIYKVSITSF